MPISPPSHKGSTTHAPDHAEGLLGWYDRHHRVLPWRVTPGQRARGVANDPYRIWLSEIMLQQTTVETVKSYYSKFVARWPDVSALAHAAESDVMAVWAGLGYYSRARNLKRCAEIIAHDHGGVFPASVEGLRALPGIGEYTAAAIGAIAYNLTTPVVDGNIERVVTRLNRIATPLPKAKPLIRDHVAALTPTGRPGDFAQAMMDLGAMICTPNNPACALCPLTDHCQARAAGDQTAYPVKPAKTNKPVRRGAAFVAQRPDGSVLLCQRPAKGLLGGMSEVPTTQWDSRHDGETGVDAAPFPAQWRRCGTVRHVFTHFSLDLAVWHCQTAANHAELGGWWSMDLDEEALPTLFRKAIAMALESQT